MKLFEIGLFDGEDAEYAAFSATQIRESKLTDAEIDMYAAQEAEERRLLLTPTAPGEHAPSDRLEKFDR